MACKKIQIMDRRDFLKMSSVAAFSAVCAWTGVSKVFSQSSDGKGQSVRGDMEHRNLGGLDVSAIGLGCLPMVGYYGGRYEKKDMIALRSYFFRYGRGVRPLYQ